MDITEILKMFLPMGLIIYIAGCVLATVSLTKLMTNFFTKIIGYIFVNWQCSGFWAVLCSFIASFLVVFYTLKTVPIDMILLFKHYAIMTIAVFGIANGWFKLQKYFSTK